MNDSDRLIDAIEEQTAIIRELVAELRSARVKPRRRYQPRASGRQIDPAVQAEADRRLARAGIVVRK